MRKIKNDRGMGIVEALVAMLLVTVALLAILTSYQQAVAMAVSTRNHNMATYLAQQVLEELKKNDGIGSFKDFDPITDVENPQTINGVEFTITQGEQINHTDNNTISVTVKVSWTEGVRAKSAEFTEYYYLAPEN